MLLVNTKKIISLAAYIKLKLEYIENNREYFTILEGQYIGKLASLQLNQNRSSYLLKNIEHQ